MDFFTPSPKVSSNRYSRRSPTQNFFLILMLGALNTLTPISIDMYLPGFPHIAADLGTDLSSVALSVSIYFLGFALGQILYGPLLDRFGRKRPLYAGLCFYILASLGCAVSQSIHAFWILRFIQALSGCVAAVAAMAMVMDFFPPEKSARLISILLLILGVSPMLAPSVGSWIIAAGSWRFIFVTLAGVAALLLVTAIFYLPEGQEPDLSVSLAPRAIFAGYRKILLTRRFIVYALAGTFSFAGLFVYVAGSPAIFMGEFHQSPKVYGFIFAGLSVGFIGSSQLNHLLHPYLRNEQILRGVLGIQTFVSVLFLVFVFSGWYGLGTVLGFLLIILSCCGLTYPNAASIALTPFSRNAGTASALLGFIQIGMGGLISSATGLLPFSGSLSTAAIMAVSASLAVFILRMGKPLP